MSIERKQVGARMSQIVIHGDTVYLAIWPAKSPRTPPASRPARTCPVRQPGCYGMERRHGDPDAQQRHHRDQPQLHSFTVTATPTDLQTTAFELLGVKPIRVQ